MAAIFRRQLADERGLPQRFKAMRFAQCRQAAKQRVDEHQSAMTIHGHVVNIQIAGGVTHLRYIQPVVTLLLLSGFEDIFKAPDLIQAAHVQTIWCRAQSHAAVKTAFKH
jgi:hypothetical protein